MRVAGVLVGPRVAAILGPVLLRELEAVVRQGTHIDDEVAAVVKDLCEAGDDYREMMSVDGHLLDPVEGLSEEWVSIAFAAAHLAKSPRQVRRLCDSGRLHARQVGRVWLVDRRSLK